MNLLYFSKYDSKGIEDSDEFDTDLEDGEKAGEEQKEEEIHAPNELKLEVCFWYIAYVLLLLMLNIIRNVHNLPLRNSLQVYNNSVTGTNELKCYVLLLLNTIHCSYLGYFRYKPKFLLFCLLPIETSRTNFSSLMIQFEFFPTVPWLYLQRPVGYCQESVPNEWVAFSDWSSSGKCLWQLATTLANCRQTLSPQTLSKLCWVTSRLQLRSIANFLIWPTKRGHGTINHMTTWRTLSLVSGWFSTRVLTHHNQWSRTLGNGR